MRVLSILLPILIASLFACKQKPYPLPPGSAPLLEKGESLFYAGNDSAFYYLNIAANSATDSLEIATAYCYMGIIQADEGDYFGAQESLLKSIPYLNERDKQHQYCFQSVYNTLGNISRELKNYDAAIDYHNKALIYIDNQKSRCIALNNIALAYEKKGNYDQSIAFYSPILAQKELDRKEYARTLSNYARTKWLKDPGYPALPELIQALQIREDSNDTRGLNASYAHLADYYTRSRPDSALYYAEKMYTTASLMKSPDDRAEALAKLIALSTPKSSQAYFTRYQYLTDSIQTARNAAKNQFALVRYGAAKALADNLQLQKDNAQKHAQLIFLVLIMLVIIAAGIARIQWSKKRRQQIESDARHRIQEHQIKTSQKVHDVVANGLYRVMSGIEHQDHINKEQLLDQIEDLYNQSRNISYEQPATPVLNFHDRIANLLTAFASNDTKVLFMGNHLELWEQTSPGTQAEVEHILQELLINMKKHSRAQRVLVRFEQQDGQVHIQYTDDGVGLPPQFKEGNGLRNTGNRIKKIGGHFTFEPTTKGVKILISFPTAATL